MKNSRNYISIRTVLLPVLSLTSILHGAELKKPDPLQLKIVEKCTNLIGRSQHIIHTISNPAQHGISINKYLHSKMDELGNEVDDLYKKTEGTDWVERLNQVEAVRTQYHEIKTSLLTKENNIPSQMAMVTKDQIDPITKQLKQVITRLNSIISYTDDPKSYVSNFTHLSESEKVQALANSSVALQLTQPTVKTHSSTSAMESTIHPDDFTKEWRAHQPTNTLNEELKSNLHNSEKNSLALNVSSSWPTSIDDQINLVTTSHWPKNLQESVLQHMYFESCKANSTQLKKIVRVMRNLNFLIPPTHRVERTTEKKPIGVVYAPRIEVIVPKIINPELYDKCSYKNKMILLKQGIKTAEKYIAIYQKAILPDTLIVIRPQQIAQLQEQKKDMLSKLNHLRSEYVDQLIKQYKSRKKNHIANRLTSTYINQIDSNKKNIKELECIIAIHKNLIATGDMQYLPQESIKWQTILEKEKINLAFLELATSNTKNFKSQHKDFSHLINIFKNNIATVNENVSKDLDFLLEKSKKFKQLKKWLSKSNPQLSKVADYIRAGNKLPPFAQTYLKNIEENTSVSVLEHILDNLTPEDVSTLASYNEVFKKRESQNSSFNKYLEQITRCEDVINRYYNRGFENPAITEIQKYIPTLEFPLDSLSRNQNKEISNRYEQLTQQFNSLKEGSAQKYIRGIEMQLKNPNHNNFMPYLTQNLKSLNEYLNEYKEFPTKELENQFQKIDFSKDTLAISDMDTRKFIENYNKIIRYNNSLQDKIYNDLKNNIDLLNNLISQKKLIGIFDKDNLNEAIALKKALIRELFQNIIIWQDKLSPTAQEKLCSDITTLEKRIKKIKLLQPKILHESSKWQGIWARLYSWFWGNKNNNDITLPPEGSLNPTIVRRTEDIHEGVWNSIKRFFGLA